MPHRAANGAYSGTRRDGARTGWSRPELISHRLGPRCRPEAVRPEEGHDDALHAEAEARGLSKAAARHVNVENLAEVLLVIVERAHRGRLLLRDDRDQDLELELLLFL